MCGGAGEAEDEGEAGEVVLVDYEGSGGSQRSAPGGSSVENDSDLEFSKLSLG